MGKKKEGHNIAIDYKTLNDNITTAIKNHLINVDALPPTTELLPLAGEITQVVFVEMNKNGLTKEFFNRNLTSATLQAAAQGRA